MNKSLITYIIIGLIEDEGEIKYAVEIFHSILDLFSTYEIKWNKTLLEI